jgi:hypothetical protein
MDKRSAMIVAAGLILVLVAGAYALALGMTGPATFASAKTSQASPQAKTVTVHKKSPSSGGVAAVSAPLPISGSYSAGSTSTGVGGSGAPQSPAGGTSSPPSGGEPGDS